MLNLLCDNLYIPQAICINQIVTINLDKKNNNIYLYEIKKNINVFEPQNAEVAELVDALGSGSSGCISVGVRVSPSAPYQIPASLFFI